jgi:hypothetical protein
MFDIGKIFTAPFTNLGDNITRPFEDPVSMLNPLEVAGFDDEESEKEEIDANGRGKDGFITVPYKQSKEEVTESTNELSSD